MFVRASGNIPMLHERVMNETDIGSLSLLRCVLGYAEQQMISSFSKVDSTAEFADVSMTWEAQALVPWECFLTLSVRKPLNFRDFYKATPAAIAASAAPFTNAQVSSDSDITTRSEPQLDGHLDKDTLEEFNLDTSFLYEDDAQKANFESQFWQFSDLHYSYSDLLRIGQETQYMQATAMRSEHSESAPDEFAMPRSRSISSTTTYTAEKSSFSSRSAVSSRSAGQYSDPGSQWINSMNGTQNSGFGYGPSNAPLRKQPKEGYEVPRPPGTVGRTGNGPREVPRGLTQAARQERLNKTLAKAMQAVFGHTSGAEAEDSNVLHGETGPEPRLHMIAERSDEEDSAEAVDRETVGGMEETLQEPGTKRKRTS